MKMFLKRIKRKLYLLKEEYKNRKYALNIYKEYKVEINNYKGKVGKLAVFGGASIDRYMDKGNDTLSTYYNPMFLFKEVHYFQEIPFYKKKLNFLYPFYIHSYNNIEEIKETMKIYKIDIIRVYEMRQFEIANTVAKSLNIPIVISLH